MKHLFTLALLLILCTGVRAQRVVSVTEQNTQTAASLALIPGATYDVVNYKMVYATVDAQGRADTSSGLLTVPQNTELAFPITAYMHGTVSDRQAVPSRVGTAERQLTAALATNGYIVVAPDYIGLGDSDGFHPYVHAASEASAGRDLILAAKEYMDSVEVAYNDQLFITGYSQGGHAAMALHEDIQQSPGSDSLVVTAGAHLSGPYSISDVMRRASLAETPATLPGYIVYTYISYDTVYDLYQNLGEVFQPAYLDLIQNFSSQTTDLDSFNRALDDRLMERNELIRDIFQDSIRQQLEENDTSSQIIQTLRLNDTYRFAPEAPTLLYYCTADEQVPFENALLADSVMTELGSTTVQTMTGGALSHGACVLPAVQSTLGFFDQYAVATPVTSTSVGGPVRIAGLLVSPNPVVAGEALRLTGLPSGTSYTYTVSDLNGRMIQHGQITSDQYISLSRDLASGMHLLRLTASDGNFTVRKLLVR